MTTQLIYDGYTRDGHINSYAGQLTFRYRPMLFADFKAMTAEAEKLAPRPQETLYAAAIAERLVSWDAVDGPAAQPAAISTASVLRLPPNIRLRLWTIITGWEASDPIPNASKPESDAYVQRLLASGGDGKPAGQAELAADRKN